MQCYTIMYYSYNRVNTMVLLARKKLEGRRFNGRQVRPIILNYAGQWVFPGGNLNKGEQPQAAALREFWEETGLDIRNDPLFDKRSQVFNGYSCTYVECADVNDLIPIQDFIQENIRSGATLDDELAEVAIMPIQDVKDYFNTLIAVHPDYQERAYQQRDWFVNMLTFL